MVNVFIEFRFRVQLHLAVLLAMKGTKSRVTVAASMLHQNFVGPHRKEGKGTKTCLTRQGYCLN